MEEYTNVTIACMKCKKKVPVKSMKYSKNGEDLICMDCHNLEKGIKPAASGSSGLVRPMPSGSPSAAMTGTKQGTKDLPSSKIAYACEKCGYKFTRSKEHPVVTCPYCNGGPLSKSESFGFYSV